jgi:WD40 repeat protein
VLSPDGRKAFTSGILEAAIWDLRSGRPICVLGVHGRYESSGEVAWSPDSRLVATGSGFYLGSYTTGAVIWDAETGRAKTQLQEDGGVRFVAFSPDGKRLFTTGAEHNVYKSCVELEPRARIWDTSSGKMVVGLQVKTFSELDSLSRAVFSADGSTIRFLTDRGTRAFSCETGEEIDNQAEGKAKYGRGGE